jgi:hypothetical protein
MSGPPEEEQGIQKSAQIARKKEALLTDFHLFQVGDKRLTA